MTASAAATTVMTSRDRIPRRRPRQSAHAAKHAAAVAEWPLGNDMPDTCTSWSTSGRGRPTTALARLLATPTPRTTTRRNRITPRDRVRIASTTATIAEITITTTVLPRSVKRFKKSVLVSVACRAAQRAISRSARATNDCRRTWNASAATARSSASVTVRARPVTLAGLSRSRMKPATRWCVVSSCCTARAVACTGPCVARTGSRFMNANTEAAMTAAMTPTSSKTTSTNIGLPRADGHRGSSRAVVLATARD